MILEKSAKELIRTYFTLSKSQGSLPLLFVPPCFSDTFRDTRDVGATLYAHTHTCLHMLEYKYIRELCTRMRTRWKVKSRASRKRNKETRGLFSPPLFSFRIFFLSLPHLPPSSHSLSPLFRSRIRGFLAGGLAAWQPLTENSN